jgi:hypothetical protein
MHFSPSGVYLIPYERKDLRPRRLARRANHENPGAKSSLELVPSRCLHGGAAPRLLQVPIQVPEHGANPRHL